jgi:hypothetical protein
MIGSGKSPALEAHAPSAGVDRTDVLGTRGTAAAVPDQVLCASQTKVADAVLFCRVFGVVMSTV